MKRVKEVLHEDYFRSLMFGLQDGIVSTTGVVIGISTGVSDKAIIVLAALVAVTVEASSMAAGQYSSEKAVHQMDKSRHTDSLYIGALIMFIAYLIGGAFSIVPILAFDQPVAKIFAVASAFTGLFIIGYLKGYLVEHKPLRSAIELFIIGAIATTVGIIVGYLFKI